MKLDVSMLKKGQIWRSETNAVLRVLDIRPGEVLLKYDSWRKAEWFSEKSIAFGQEYQLDEVHSVRLILEKYDS